MNLDDNYQEWGRVDVIVQKLQAIVPNYAQEESQVKIKELEQYCLENKIAMIDPPRNAMVVQNRLLFLKNMHNAVE